MHLCNVRCRDMLFLPTKKKDKEKEVEKWVRVSASAREGLTGQKKKDVRAVFSSSFLYNAFIYYYYFITKASAGYLKMSRKYKAIKLFDRYRLLGASAFVRLRWCV